MKLRYSKYLRPTLALGGLALSFTALAGWCETSGCQAIKNAGLLGIQVSTWGLLYFAILFLLLTLENLPLTPLVTISRSFLLAAGMGCDSSLVIGLISARTFCAVCLGITAIMLLLCGTEALTMIRRLRSLETGRFRLVLGKAVSCAAAFSLGMFFVAFTYSLPMPEFGVAYAASDEAMPSIGQGQTCIRIYSDYFCPGCRKHEAEIAGLIQAILQERAHDCKICFVDVPMHGQATQNYSAYFAACYSADRSARNILKARQVLFQLAERRVQDRGTIEQSLKNAGVRFTMDYGSIFHYFNEANRLIREDNVIATPTVVVVGKGGKTVLRGGKINKNTILGAL